MTKAIVLSQLSLFGLLAASPDPCQFLTDAEVRQFLPGVKPGRLDRSNEDAGVVGCRWDAPTGRLGISFLDDQNEPVEKAARQFIEGFVDPLKPGAEKLVRVEKLAIPGGQAAAVVESADDAKGLFDAAYVTVRGKRYQATLFTRGLSARDRAGKLKALETLARAAAARM